MSNKAKSERPIGFRPPVDLKSKMDQWLAKNPGIDRSTMICLAVDKFITAPQTLEPVEVVQADHQEAMKVAATMMDRHAHAIEKLK